MSWIREFDAAQTIDDLKTSQPIAGNQYRRITYMIYEYIRINGTMNLFWTSESSCALNESNLDFSDLMNVLSRRR